MRKLRHREVEHLIIQPVGFRARIVIHLPWASCRVIGKQAGPAVQCLERAAMSNEKGEALGF